MLMKIGELAKRVGLTVRALHHYDQIGLLSPSARSHSGFRLYTQDDVVRLHRIQALKQFGCSLSRIRAFLAEPDASPIEIISQQVRVLEEQTQHAQSLRDRLCRLRDRLSRGEDTGLTDWLSILEMMTLYEQHLSREELDRLLSRKATRRLDKEWRQFVSMVRELMDRGVPPGARKAQKLAWDWMRLLRDTTGNDLGLAMKLKAIHRERPKAGLFDGLSSEMIDYLTQAYANARAGVLAHHLSPDDLERVRSRQASHMFEWPQLIVEARRQFEGGAAPDDPDMQVLAQRWESVLRESYSGDDRELEAKIHAAFRKEPELMASVWIDGPLAAFVEKAVAHFRSGRERAKGSLDVVPKPTASRVAIYRAAHQLLDAPLVFNDPLALKILGAAGEETLRKDLSQHNTPLLRGLRVSVAIRSRLAEDEWSRSQLRGVRQFVILGAGLDTYAYRHREQHQDRDGVSIRVFEVDLPETQRWKRERLRAAGIAEPAWLTFVPVDFERSTLAESLRLAGFPSDEPACFSWLGVTMYIEESTVVSTLRFIASLAPGSSVVFDYTVQPSLLSPRERSSMEALASRAGRAGEPWKTFFDPPSLVATLYSLGFREVEDHGPVELNERYLSGRSDGLRKSGVSRLTCARV